jgi:hypothetical protein
MRYLFVRWNHDDDEEPFELYSELDDAGWEVRKVERFRDGKLGFAGSKGHCASTRLGDAPIPDLSEIQADPQFDARWIELSEFE